MNFEEQLIKQLTRIADSLERLNEDKSVVANVNSASAPSIKDIAEELSQFEPALARLLLQYT